MYNITSSTINSFPGIPTLQKCFQKDTKRTNYVNVILYADLSIWKRIHYLTYENNKQTWPCVFLQSKHTISRYFFLSIQFQSTSLKKKKKKNHYFIHSLLNKFRHIWTAMTVLGATESEVVLMWWIISNGVRCHMIIFFFFFSINSRGYNTKN